MREETATEPVGVAIVGLGFWGGVLAEAAARTSAMQLVACVSRRAEQAEAFAQRFDCEALTSLEQALRRPDVEAVILTTENPEHAAGIEAAARAGRHVFVEKPITNRPDEARRVADVAAEAGVVLAVGHEFRRAGAAWTMKQLVDDGVIGTVVLAEANYSLTAALQPGSWKWSETGCPGGTLIQIGIHHLDTLSYLLGDARVVAAHLARRGTEAPIPTVAAVTLAYAGGATAVVTSSYVSPWTYFIHLYGTDGALFYRVEPGRRVLPDTLDERTHLILQRGDAVEEISFTPRDPLVDQFEEFAAAIRGEREVEVGAAEGIAALDLVWQALKMA